MNGPSYQQFQGYPNVVGNFSAGLDAGRDRAANAFTDKQTMETQNALVQQSGAQSYPQYQAQQMQAKQLYDLYGPSIAPALASNNTGFLRAVGDAYEKSGNTLLKPMAQMLKTINTTDGKEFTFTTSVDSLESAQRLAQKYPSMLKIFGSADMIPRNVPLDFTSVGAPTDPGSTITKAVHSKGIAQPKTPPSQVLVPNEETRQKLLADPANQDPAVQNLLTGVVPGMSASVVLSGRDAEGVYHGGVLGKAPTAKFRSDSVSTAAGLQAAVVDAPPAIAQKILTEAAPAVKKGYTVVLERDSNGALTGLIRAEKRPSAGGASGAGAGGTGGGQFPSLKYNDTGKYYGSLFKKPGGEVEFATLVSRYLAASATGGRNAAASTLGLSAGKQNDARREEFVARLSDYMGSYGITQADITDAAGALSATKQISKQQGMLEINASVAEKGFSMLSDLRKKGQISTGAIPLLNHAENLLRTWTGDAPPGAAQGVLTEVLVDYAKVVSGQTSTAGVTMYAAKLAKELMELKDNPAQFQLKLDQYSKLMNARLTGGRTVLKGLSKVTDLGNKGKGPGLDNYISTMVQKYPQYKSKTRTEWQAVYDKKFSGGQ